jgi:biopolymer transport protein ExbD
MKLRSLRLSDQPQLMIIPMIDIIFFLLVFFMMTTLYMVEQHGIPVNLPQAAAASRQEKPHSVTVTVMQDGTVMVDEESLAPSSLAQRIGFILAEQPDTVFVLRADKQTEYGSVVTVLDGLKTAGAQKISVATERKAR